MIAKFSMIEITLEMGLIPGSCIKIMIFLKCFFVHEELTPELIFYNVGTRQTYHYLVTIVTSSQLDLGLGANKIKLRQVEGKFNGK